MPAAVAPSHASRCIRKSLLAFLLLAALAPLAFAQQKQQVLWEKMQAEIMGAGQQLDGAMGVAIVDLTNGQKLLINPDEVFAQASSIKIAVLAELYTQEQQGLGGGAGRARLSDLYTVRKQDVVPGSDIMGGLSPGVTRVTNRDLATMMVAVSDNSATNVLIDRLGMENVNEMLDSLGLKNTRLRRRMMDVKAAAEGRENISTPREMAVLLETIYGGKLFSKELTEDFFKVLATHKSSPITHALPDDAKFADKPGELEAVRNDSGIVWAPNRPFIICVMTSYLKNEREGEAAISRVASAAWSYFDRLGRASPLGRVVSSK